jgi:hypothetical protein
MPLPKNGSAMLRWFLRALPLFAAVLGPYAAAGSAPWIVKVGAGFCFGLALSLVAWQAQHVPPISTLLAGCAAASLVVSVLLISVVGGGATVGLLVVLCVVAALVYWGLTRA